MTLIVNEIRYYPGAPSLSRIIAAADSQITRKGLPIAPCRKLFGIIDLNATVSYFGLADADKSESFEDLIAAFLLRHSTNDIESFAHALTRELNARVDKAWLVDEPSGLHVCGFTLKGVPEFWFIRNIQGMNRYDYTGFRPEYEVTEELRGQHQRDNYDSTGGEFIQAFGMNFTNGDLRPFHHAWELLDSFVAQMELEHVAVRPTSHSEFLERVKWKMRTIAGFYEGIATEKLIGEPIEAILLTPK
jgi:hypothetical protein